MFIANDTNGNQIYAHDAIKGQNYFCPVCETPVILKMGSIKVSHFSHHHILLCNRYLYKRESPLHLKLKHDLYLQLNKHYNVAMEYYLERIEQIPDVLVENTLAVEIQLSRISPDLITARSKGYYKLGMSVIWLLDDKEIKRVDDLLYLNHFQLSTMTNGMIFTLDTATLKMTALSIGHHIGLNRFTFSKRIVALSEIMSFENNAIFEGEYRLSRANIKQLIKREKTQRTVQNPTLSYMYQLELTIDNLPEFLYLTSQYEKYILNSPIEWKLYVYYHLSKGIFNRRQFYNFIKVRELADRPDKETIVQSLLLFYLKVFRVSEDIT